MNGSFISNVRGEVGVFSNFLQFCDNLEYCERNNLKPIFTMRGPSFYNKTSEDTWNKYFIPLNDGIIEGNVTYASDYNYFPLWNEKFVCFQGKVPIWDLHKDEVSCKKNRVLVNKVAKKFQPIEKIQNIIKKFIEKNFGTKKVLGIHCRTTDYGFYDLPKYESAVNFENYDVIFVASDSSEAINYFKKKYNNVVSYETEIRMTNMNMGVLPRNLKVEDMEKHVEDVIVECFILSNCNHIVCINSNVAAAALYLNPEVTFNLIHRVEQGG